MGCGSSIGAIGGAIVGGIAGGPAGALLGASIGGGVGGSMDGAKMPKMPPAPTPASYIYYDEDGNVASEMKWDASANSYISRVNPEPEAPKRPEGMSDADWASSRDFITWKENHDTWTADKAARDAEEQKRTDLRNQMLSNLDKAPEDRLKMYDDYAKTYSEMMHKDVDERYAKQVQGSNEDMEARGLFGSRAYVDTQAELNKEKGALDTDIANRAIMAKEDLANTDRNYWLNTLGYLDAGGRADEALALQKTGQAANTALGTYGAQNNAWANQSNMALQRWGMKENIRQNNMNTLVNTGAGLAFLYGFPGKSAAPTATTGSGGGAYTGAFDMSTNWPKV